MEPENTSAATHSSVNSLGEELQQQVSALTDVVQTLLVRSNEDRRRLDLVAADAGYKFARVAQILVVIVFFGNCTCPHATGREYR